MNSLTCISKSYSLTGLVALGFISSMAFCSLVKAQAIAPGFDLYTTIEQSVKLSGVDPIEFAGIAPVPVESQPLAGTKGSDTIIMRLDGIDPFPIDTEFTISAKLFALSPRRSINPVNIDGTLYDLLITKVPGAIGSIKIVRESDIGGSFQYMIPVEGEILFTEVENSSNSFTKPFFDTFLFGGEWSYTPLPNDPHNMNYPAGSFYLKSPLYEEETPAWSHRKVAEPIFSVPEPTSTLHLLALGILGTASTLKYKLKLSKSSEKQLEKVS